jgi:hypothetical protein
VVGREDLPWGSSAVFSPEIKKLRESFFVTFCLLGGHIGVLLRIVPSILGLALSSALISITSIFLIVAFLILIFFLDSFSEYFCKFADDTNLAMSMSFLQKP